MPPSATMGPGPLPPSWLDRLRGAPSAERRSIAASAPVGWPAILTGLVDGPEPEPALVRAQGLPAAMFEAPWPPRLTHLLHHGSYPARLVSLDPSASDVLSPDAEYSGPAEALEHALAHHPIDEALGRVRTREYLRLAAREVEGGSLEEVGGDLCTLVAALLQGLLEQLSLADDVVVFGMGKLGGHELNFLSDIDLVFVHDDAVADSSRRGAVAELHGRLRQLVRHLEGKGRWRPLFRVDLRLRPFGTRGPLSTSVTATEAYYERHGRPWERQVWLRARPLAGRIDLGELLVRRLTPFVYRRSVGPEIFSEIADMMRRARREATRVGDDAAVDLKLDAGGIREIEFTAQALQLLHGGRNPAVRHTSTLPALDRLLAAGLVSDREHRELSEAYRWLRRVEHRVQLAEGQQTHHVPSEPEARDQLRRRLHWPRDDPAAFERDLTSHRERSQAIARTIAGEDEADDARSHDLAVVLDEGAPRARHHAALRRLGVHDPEQTESLLEHLRTRPDGAFIARGQARRGAENLLRACLDSADPVAAVERLVELAASRPSHYALWRAFANPSPVGVDLLRLTGELLGASEPLSRGLIGFPPGRPDGATRTTTPADPIVGLLERAAEPALPDATSLAIDLSRQQPDPRGLDATLLHFKHQQLVRVGLQDLGRRPDPLEVGRSISDIADLVLRMVMDDLAEHTEGGPAFELAVLALGKHGMRAMDYGSDLDLMFVFEPVDDGRRAEAQTHATKLAQRAMSRLQSRALGLRLFEVDMRLRPSGREGLLVTSLTGFRRYHQRHVAVWERLAMLRMRPVAEIHCGPGGNATSTQASSDGPPDRRDPSVAALPGRLGAAVRQTVDGALGWTDPSTAALGRDEILPQTRRLRDRIERELSRENRASGWYNAKTGAGGCLELELLVAALQLVHGPHVPDARAPGIIEALAGLGSAGVLSADETSALCADYRFSRRLLNRLRMSPGRRGQDPDRFSENSPRLVTLARRMGLSGRTALLERFFHARARIRAAFDLHLPG